MRVHHLDCNSECPLGGGLFDGHPGLLRPARLTCHCLLVELPDRLVLVDTGFGLNDCAAPRPRLAASFLAMNRPELRAEKTAVRQLQRMGFAAEDVTDILLTHLDFDHAGGLDDFPNARIHLLAAEAESAVAQATPLDRRRYRPRQWSSAPRWRTYHPRDGERWFGFPCVSELDGLPPELLIVPLIGHTLGHAGIALQAGDGWMLHAGDAYFYHAEMDFRAPRCTPAAMAYQRVMRKDPRRWRENRERLRELKHRQGPGLMLFCAHDLTEFERLVSLSPRTFPDARRATPMEGPWHEDGPPMLA